MHTVLVMCALYECYFRADKIIRVNFFHDRDKWHFS